MRFGQTLILWRQIVFSLVLVGLWPTLGLDWSSHVVLVLPCAMTQYHQYPDILPQADAKHSNQSHIWQFFWVLSSHSEQLLFLEGPSNGWISGVPIGRLKKVEREHSKQIFVELPQIFLGQIFLFYHGWNCLCLMVLVMRRLHQKFSEDPITRWSSTNGFSQVQPVL